MDVFNVHLKVDVFEKETKKEEDKTQDWKAGGFDFKSNDFGGGAAAGGTVSMDYGGGAGGTVSMDYGGDANTVAMDYGGGAGNKFYEGGEFLSMDNR